MNIFSAPSTAQLSPAHSDASASTSSTSNQQGSNSDGDFLDTSDSDYLSESRAGREDLDRLLQKARESAKAGTGKGKGKEIVSKHSDSDGLMSGVDIVRIDDDKNKDDSNTDNNNSNDNASAIDPSLVVPASVGKEATDTQSTHDNPRPSSTNPPLNPKQHTMSRKEKREAAARKHVANTHFGMSAPTMTPELKREIQALRLHSAMDPKRFLRGEAKRENAKLPEYFQMGYIVDQGSRVTNTSTGSGKVDKRGFVEALLDDEEAKAYASKKYKESQKRAMSGRGGEYAISRKNKRRR